MRAATYLGVFVFCLACWFALYSAALMAGLYLWRLITMIHTGGVFALLLLAGGLALIGSGLGMRALAMRWIDGRIGWPLAQASRYVVGLGSLVMAAGAGGIIVLQAGALG